MMQYNALIDTFIELVKIDSPTGEEEAVLEFIDGYLVSLGFSSIKDTYGNRIVKIPGKGKPLLLSAHVDTVEPGRNIRPIIENGVIKTDGTTILGADNKVGLAVILDVIGILQETKQEHRPIEIVFTKSEEVGNFGAVNLDYRILNAKEGYLFDNCNPVGTIIYASPYYYRFDLTIFGKAAHASSPHKAINVLPVFSDALQSIKLGKISETTIANIGKVHAGHVRNTIPGELSVAGEVRGFIDSETKAYIHKIVRDFKNSAKKFQCSLEASVICENSGYLNKQDDPFILETKAKMESLKLAPRLQTSMGCSDANIFQEHGIMVLDLGDGSVGAHTVQEKVGIQDLLSLSELVLALIK